MLARLLTLGLVVLLMLPIAEGAHGPPAAAKKKTKTVTRTIANTGAISIPLAGEASPFPATLQVGGFKKGAITDVNLTLHGFSHQTPDEVGVMVVAPNGKPALVMSNVGAGDDAVNLTLTFDDEAGATLPDATQLVSGTFRPSVSEFPSNTSAPYPALSAFDGSNPNGQWQLFVFDDDGGELGEIAGGWSLEITAKVKKKK
jgi:hypothetical protein